MMRFSVLIFALGFITCSQKQPATLGETPYQIEQNNIFKDASKSPLRAKDLKTFAGLDFFKFDSLYVVKAKLKRTPDADWFSMSTTTKRVSKERVYGVVTFMLKQQRFTLNIYQGEENMTTKGYEDYLFLPFLDDTNGNTTYGGGRYIDLRIPDADTITIDFNKAYNPLCVYNEKYSCPIVPRENYIATTVNAGVKAFKK